MAAPVERALPVADVDTPRIGHAGSGSLSAGRRLGRRRGQGGDLRGRLACRPDDARQEGVEFRVERLRELLDLADDLRLGELLERQRAVVDDGQALGFYPVDLALTSARKVLRSPSTPVSGLLMVIPASVRGGREGDAGSSAHALAGGLGAALRRDRGDGLAVRRPQEDRRGPAGTRGRTRRGCAGPRRACPVPSRARRPCRPRSRRRRGCWRASRPGPSARRRARCGAARSRPSATVQGMQVGFAHVRLLAGSKWCRSTQHSR